MKKVILVILDGWGKGQIPEVDAIAQANTPFVDSLYEKYPNADLITFGEKVGLPEGQMGNSEVGHLNIGAGRVVYQEFARINKSIREREFHKNKDLLAALDYAKKEGKNVHFMGLLSDGGVHSHINHVKALCDIVEENGVENAFIHAFMDGRDTSPHGGQNYLKDLLQHIENQPTKLASVIGRYYAMDRDNRWERIKLAYDLLVNGKGEGSTDILETVKNHYDAGETDEFLQPIFCADEKGNPLATFQEDDVLICFNFRTDRPREISIVLTQKDMPEHGMKTIPLRYLTMTNYNEEFKNLTVLFAKQKIENTLGEILSKAGKTQVRIAETEKYPHVTFFFNGGKEQPYPNEKRLIVKSPSVATYDLQPEMSAPEVTKTIVDEIITNKPDFVCLNYANADMVGHTGDFEAAMKAVEATDNCLNSLLETCLAFDYQAIVIADHGNSDIMKNPDGSAHTAHTTNLVPIFYINKVASGKVKNGKLGDLAPTILSLMGMESPKEMTGEILVEA